MTFYEQFVTLKSSVRFPVVIGRLGPYLGTGVARCLETPEFIILQECYDTPITVLYPSGPGS